MNVADTHHPPPPPPPPPPPELPPPPEPDELLGEGMALAMLDDIDDTNPDVARPREDEFQLEPLYQRGL